MIGIACGAIAAGHAAHAFLDAGTGGTPPLRIVGDAIPEPLAGTPGDASRGRALVERLWVVSTRREEHATPTGGTQSFVWTLAQRAQRPRLR